MRICHIGHGRIPIPPTRWGAVESIIADYQFHCERLGHEFLVVNSAHPSEALNLTRVLSPDIAHLHDETKIDEFAKLDVLVKIVTTHDPTFFEKPNPFVERFVGGDFLVGCLSVEQRFAFNLAGVSVDRTFDTINGARSDLIRFSKVPQFPHRMICLGMIGQRKRQHLLLGIPFVDCIGPVASYDPIVTTGVTFDSWTRRQVYDHLTEYGALVLLSKSEADPLVVKEALTAGLDIVVSEAASANLDRKQPFIHILPESTISNPTLLRVTLENIVKSPKDRAAVLRYAERNFDWGVLVKRYLEQCERFLSLSSPRTPASLPSG